MKNISIITSVLASCLTLSACGSADDPTFVSDSDTSKQEFTSSLAKTTWGNNCFPIYDGQNVVAYNNSEININEALQSTTKVEVFDVADFMCDQVITEINFTTQLELTEKIVTDESIEAYGINITFVSSPDITEISESYSLIYIDSEKLYMGQSVAENSGETAETRHTSISLEHYFSQIIN